MAGQFDSILKKGNDTKPSVIPPIPYNRPGRVINSEVVGAYTATADDKPTSLPVRPLPVSKTRMDRKRAKGEASTTMRLGATGIPYDTDQDSKETIKGPVGDLTPPKGPFIDYTPPKFRTEAGPQPDASDPRGDMFDDEGKPKGNYADPSSPMSTTMRMQDTSTRRNRSEPRAIDYGNPPAPVGTSTSQFKDYIPTSVTAKRSTLDPISSDSDFKDRTDYQESIDEPKKPEFTKEEDTPEDQELTKTGQADFVRERKLKGKRNAKPAEEIADPYTKDGNIKPEYDTLDSIPKNTPLTSEQRVLAARSTSMREVATPSKKSRSVVDIPAYTSPKESTDPISFPEITAKESVTLDPEVSYQEGQFRSVPKTPTSKPEVAKTGNVVPARAIATNYDENLDVAKETEADKRRRGNKSPAGSKTTELDLNVLSGRNTGTPTAEKGMVSDSKRRERNEELVAQGKKFTTHSPTVTTIASAMARRDGITHDPSSPEFQSGKNIRKAYVMHKAGVASNEDLLNTHLGKNAGNADRTLRTAYSSFQNKERFDATKAPGTGYTHDANPNTDYFKESNGSYVPMSQTAHPEHPGFSLEGSSVPFKGFHTSSNGAVKRVDVHQGWHPYERLNTDGKKIRVFENHSIPVNAVHESEISGQAIRGGITTRQAYSQLMGGNSEIMVRGASATPAQPAPIVGGMSAASRKNHNEKVSKIIEEQRGSAETVVRPPALGSQGGSTPTAPMRGRVARSNVNTPDVAPVITDLNTEERKNKENMDVANVADDDDYNSKSNMLARLANPKRPKFTEVKPTIEEK
jgi:hypothetical protein